ncbi:archaeosortase/exosortase family protein [Sporocytophaga myxococcoides]|uniref:archaeosortase/exosortase family protein n=1 Tax=Sporocytophaga myxococcoides TaxID=153721 RepID=UPI00041C0DD3|nr:archaeosortase/exosortase family protein [Sporocytophaga myxococcoides]
MSFFSRKNPVFVFLATVIVLYIIWETFYASYLCASPFSYKISSFLGWTSSYFFSLTGLKLNWIEATYCISIDGRPALYIGNSCNGLAFFGLFTCFVLAFPASWKSKLWFLPLGILAIHVLNMIRVILLILNFYFYNTSFDFNHKYTFNFVVYGFMLLVWLYWAKKQLPDAAQTA